MYCNCDDPRVSNFFHYFSYNFERLGLKKLITACYRNQERDMFSRHDSEQAIWLEYTGNAKGGREPDIEDIGVREFNGDGDFRSAESIELLKQADIVVTNPPFSLFREYVAQLLEYGKKFLIIGSKNAITYKEIFPLIKENLVWLGYGFSNGNAYFKVADVERYESKSYFDEATGLVKFRNVGWFTNLDHAKRHEELILYKRYSPAEYPAYDNYDAINVDKTAEIPMDWDRAMGVPITFLDKHNPEQFEVLGITDRDNNSGLKTKEYTLANVPNPGDLNRRGVIRVGGKHKPTTAYPVDSADPYMLWLRSTGGFRPWSDLIFRAPWLSSKAVSRPTMTAGAIWLTAAGLMATGVSDVVMRRRTS